nr:retrotransposon protein, putative, Ty1-copia subclass [Tanacetum cinerariifolium]
MLGQSRGCESFAGTKDYGANQKVEFDTPDRVVIKEEHQEKNNTDQPEKLEQIEPQVKPVEKEADNTGTGVEDSIAVRKRKRNAPRPARYAGCVNTYDIDSMVYALAVGDDIGSDDSKTYKEAVASKDVENWIIAINEEMQSLEKNKTWDLVTLPKGMNPVRCKWVLKRKERIPSMVGAFNLELEQLDVKTAFLHGNLKERIYMSQPEGFNNSKRDLFDNYVYSNKVSADSYVYLLLYVGDMLIAAKNMAVMNDLKALLKSVGAFVCFVIIALDITAGILGIKAEAAQNQEKHLRLWLFECKEPSQEAYKLGFAAIVLLIVAHVLANLLSGCTACSRDEIHKASTGRQLSLLSLFFA